MVCSGLSPLTGPRRWTISSPGSEKKVDGKALGILGELAMFSPPSADFQNAVYFYVS